MNNLPWRMMILKNELTQNDLTFALTELKKKKIECLYREWRYYSN